MIIPVMSFVFCCSFDRKKQNTHTHKSCMFGVYLNDKNKNIVVTYENNEKKITQRKHQMPVNFGTKKQFIFSNIFQY